MTDQRNITSENARGFFEELRRQYPTPSVGRMNECKKWQSWFGLLEKYQRPLPSVFIYIDNVETEIPGDIIENGTAVEYRFWKQFLTNEHYVCRPYEINFLKALCEWIKNGQVGDPPLITGMESGIAINQSLGWSSRGPVDGQPPEGLVTVDVAHQEQGTSNSNNHTAGNEEEDEDDEDKELIKEDDVVGSSTPQGTSRTTENDTRRTTTPYQTPPSHLRLSHLYDDPEHVRPYRTSRVRFQDEEDNPFMAQQQYVPKVRLYNAETFKGDGKDVIEWIEGIEMLLSLQIGWNEAMKMAAVVPLLEEGARTNYISYQKSTHNSIKTWTQLKVWLRQQYVNEFVYLETLRKFNALTCRRGRERQFVMECQKLMPILRDEINEQLLVEMVCEKVQDNIIRSRLFERRDTKLVDVFTYLLRMATSNEMMNQQRGATQMPWSRPPRSDTQPRNQPVRQSAYNNNSSRRNMPPITEPQRRRRLECYICSSLSHLQAQCPYRQQQPQQLRLMEEQPPYQPASQSQILQQSQSQPPSSSSSQNIDEHTNDLVGNVASNSLN
jgi:hypothetical protein